MLLPEDQRKSQSAKTRAYKRVGRFLLKTSAPLGQGNFSTVYSARDQTKDQMKQSLVAVKAVSFQKMQTPIAHELLANQVNILTSLDSPYTLKCLHTYRSSHYFYFVTELCSGGDLEKILKQCGPLKEKNVARVATDVYFGLLYLNTQQIIHRDIKCSNIFLDGHGKAKIADFGFAVKGKECTEKFDIGSPIYMSPESLLERKFSQKSDVWSFGVMLYELLHGIPPLGHCKSIQEIRKQILKPVVFRKDLSPDLVCFLRGCLTVEPSRRLDIAQIANTDYFNRIMKPAPQTKKAQSLQSTRASEAEKQLAFPTLDSRTFVALLHYCRLLFKTMERNKCSGLSEWLLCVSDSLMRAEVSAGDQLLKTVVREYNQKFHLHFKKGRNVSFKEALLQISELRKVHFKTEFKMLTQETTLLEFCHARGELKRFARLSVSRLFIQQQHL